MEDILIIMNTKFIDIVTDWLNSKASQEEVNELLDTISKLSARENAYQDTSRINRKVVIGKLINSLANQPALDAVRYLKHSTNMDLKEAKEYYDVLLKSCRTE